MKDLNQQVEFKELVTPETVMEIEEYCETYIRPAMRSLFDFLNDLWRDVE